MTLLELCDPLFQYVCQLNRSARNGAVTNREQVRIHLEQILGNMHADAEKIGPTTAGQLEQIRLPLLFFIDYIIRTGDLKMPQPWEDLAAQEGIFDGDEQFFDVHLDKTLRDRSEAASERLAVLYTCMGLGFAGVHVGNAQVLRTKMLECANRLRGLIDADPRSELCPEALKTVDRSRLTEPPLPKLLLGGVALVGFVILLFALNVYGYTRATSELKGAFQAIIDLGSAH
jgi:type VI protein secretion system component VasF